MTGRAVRLYYLVFFAAGMPALVYQVVWQAVLKLYFGVDVYSAAVTIAAFMLGLGAGSLVGGYLADRVRRHALWYAGLESLLALFGFTSIPVLTTVGRLLADGPLAATVIAQFLILLGPTAVMGMTLPLMCRVVTGRDATIGRHLSWLYGVNTLGAAVGALATAYALVGLMGMDGATSAAAVLNVTVAVVVILAALRVPSVSAADEQPAEPAPTAPVPMQPPDATETSFGVIQLLSFLSGFVALGFEVVWYRVLGCLLHGTVYVFGTILFFYLLGIALGSLRARRRIDLPGNLARFALCQLGIAAYGLAFFGVLGHLSWLPGLRHLIAASTLISFHPAPELAAGHLDIFSVYSLLDIAIWSAGMLLVPTMLMGYGFPNLMRAGSRHVERLGRSVGQLYFANVLGSALGGLAAGFLGVHYLGTKNTLRALIVLSAAVPLFVFLLRMRRPSIQPIAPRRLRDRAWLGLSAVVLLLGVVVFPTPQMILRAIHYAESPAVESVIREDRTGVVALRRQNRVITFPQEEKIVGVWRLLIDGATHGSFAAHAADSTRDVLVKVALAGHRAPVRVLSIGLGDGNMCATAEAHHGVRELVIVELNGALRPVLEPTEAGRFLGSPKVTYIVDDGRRWLLRHGAETFDVVVMFPLHAAHAGHGSLYSLEFLELLRSRLRPGGILATRTADPFSTARTLATVFPHLIRLDDSGYVASTAPLRFDPADLPMPAKELLTRITADRQVVLDQTADVPLNTDVRRNAEYYVTYPYAEYLGTWESTKDLGGVHDPARYVELLLDSPRKSE